jgi:hypothetical protein
MHTIIYALVEASTHEAALTAGRGIFSRLVGATPDSAASFDYFVMFDETEPTVAGTARWGDYPTAATLDSAEGQALLDRGWTATETTFERNLERVKDALAEYTDEEIMRDVDLTRHAFYQVGAYEGPTIFLYDGTATGIRHRDHLDRILEEGDSLWIVPADVHF